MPPTFLRAYPPAQPAPGPALWFPFRDSELLLREQGTGVALPHGGAELLAPLAPGTVLYLGTLQGTPCLTCAVSPEIVQPSGWRAVGLQALYGLLGEPEYGLAGYASQMLYWQRTSRYCPVCGQPTEVLAGDWGKRCTGCGHTRYPHISPAVLALIYDGDRVLLANKREWSTMHSVIAGFVEPGESLEECVHREVYEEVGLEVADLAYAGSQPWPYPHQLMIGYTARYAGGELRLDTHELAHAAWLRFDALPDLPPPFSLARQMINAWAAARQGNFKVS